MWTLSDDPVRDFEAYDHDLHRNDHLYPVCPECEQHVLPGELYAKIGGKYYHEDCVKFHEMEEYDD